MVNMTRFHGGIVFTPAPDGSPDGNIEPFHHIVVSTLEDYGHSIESRHFTGPSSARIVTARYLIDLALAAHPAPLDGEAAPCPRARLEITIRPAADIHAERDIVELLLVVMLYRMTESCDAEAIEWLAPETVLTVRQFLNAFAVVTPRRVRSRKRVMADLVPTGAAAAPHSGMAPGGQMPDETEETEETEEEALARAFRCECADPAGPEGRQGVRASDVRRLATWGMTGMLAVVSAPAAIPIAALNLARGEDFRLNTQILSLAGLLTTLGSTGAFGNLAQLLPV